MYLILNGLCRPLLPSLVKGNFFICLHMFLTEFFFLKYGWPKWWTVFTQISTCVFPLQKFHMTYLTLVLPTVINNGQKFVIRLIPNTGRPGSTIMSKCSIFLLVAEIISTSYTCDLKFNVAILSHFFPVIPNWQQVVQFFMKKCSYSIIASFANFENNFQQFGPYEFWRKH